MRLIDIKRNIEIAFQNYHFHTKELSGDTVQYEGVNGIREALVALSSVGFIDKDEDPFSLFITTYSDTLIASYSSHPNINKKMSALGFMIDQLFYWINEYITDGEDDTTINIKLPDLNRIEDLVNASTIINKSLSLPLSEIGGEMKVKHLDYGSSWVIISAGTALAAKLAIVLANAAFKIAQKYYGIRMMQQQYERYSMGTDMLRTIKEANEKIIADDTRLLAEHIEKDFYPDSDNERIERLRVSISEMTKLIELGGEVHPSLLTVQNDKTQTPDYKSLLGIIKSVTELPRNEEPKSGGEDTPNEG